MPFWFKADDIWFESEKKRDMPEKTMNQGGCFMNRNNDLPQDHLPQDQCGHNKSPICFNTKDMKHPLG